MANVGCSDCVPKFQRTRTNQEVRQRDAYPHCLTLPVNPTGTEGNGNRQWLNRNAHKQFIKKALPAFAPYRCVCSGKAVCQLKHGDDGETNFFIARTRGDAGEELAGVLALALGGNQGR